MTLPVSISSTLDWKLLSGSHEFPGPDGGTCINEAAIVAAGFEYRSVSSWHDCPPCFSPIISSWAISLNDGMSKENRKALLPFVMRMAGTKGSYDTEKRRAEHLILSTTRIEGAGMAEKMGQIAIAARLRNCTSVDDARAILKEFSAIADAYVSAYANAIADAIAYVSANATDDAIADVIASADAKQYWFKTRGVQLLDEMINIHPGPALDVEIASCRLHEARAAARCKVVA